VQSVGDLFAIQKSAPATLLTPESPPSVSGLAEIDPTVPSPGNFD
jgi:hypothetical protein